MGLLAFSSISPLPENVSQPVTKVIVVPTVTVLETITPPPVVALPGTGSSNTGSSLLIQAV